MAENHVLRDIYWGFHCAVFLIEHTPLCFELNKGKKE